MALPRETYVPMGREGLPLEGAPAPPSSGPLLLQPPHWALLGPGSGSTPELPAQPPTALQPGALGFLFPTGRALGGTWESQGTCPSAKCPQGWLSPVPHLALRCCPWSHGTRQASRPQEPPCQPRSVSVLSALLCAVPCTGCWVVAKIRPLEPNASVSRVGSPALSGHLAQC